MNTVNNLPKMSNRATKALDVLNKGGRFSYRLERNRFTGREQFQYRLFDARGNTVSGIGHSTYHELDGHKLLVWANSTSVSTDYIIRTERNEKIAALTQAARGPAEGWETAGWEGRAAEAQAELAALLNNG